jgi:hypothetical protein
MFLKKWLVVIGSKEKLNQTTNVRICLRPGPIQLEPSGLTSLLGVSGPTQNLIDHHQPNLRRPIAASPARTSPEPGSDVVAASGSPMEHAAGSSSLPVVHSRRYDSPYILRGTLATACASRNCGMRVRLVWDLFFSAVAFGARFFANV